MIHCRAPQNDAEFIQYYQLRWQVLRAPWQQPQGSEKDELELSAVHRMIIDEQGNVLAVGRLHIDQNWCGHIRYMATASDAQGNGYGKAVIDALEAEASQRGVKKICLNARELAVAFYEKLGYQVTGSAHVLYDEIQHFSMEKSLGEAKESHSELLKQLQSTWHQTIPMSLAMGMSADYFDGQQFVTHCDVSFNKNLHNTMFAGSIYTLATLTGWGWVYLSLQTANIDADIVLAKADIKYLAPIPDVACAKVDVNKIQGDVAQLSQSNKARFTLSINLFSGDKIAATFNGAYVAIKS